MTRTNREICQEALEKIGVVAAGAPMDPHDLNTAVSGLDRLLKSWQNTGHTLWKYDRQSVSLTTASSYTLSDRPLRILNARLKKQGIEIPMVELTREEYDTLPQKGSTGVPTQFYYDRRQIEGVLYIWPLLSVVNGETVEISQVSSFSDVVVNANAEVPDEWLEAVVYGLAARLADEFEVPADRVRMRAEIEFDRALGADREGSVFFMAD